MSPEPTERFGLRPDPRVEILLVEDNPNDVELTLDAFRENKLTNPIQVMRDGVEALDFLLYRGVYAQRSGGNPKIVLLDLKLPRLGGKEVLQAIRNDERTKMIPVVILTSSAEERDIFESYQLGVNSYIVKPVDFDQFTAAARQIGLYWLLLNKPPLF